MIEPAHVDGPFMLWNGEVREVLAAIPDGAVDCVVTSPPYWGLRDYGTPAFVWGGAAGCEHEWGHELVERLQSGNFNEGFNERWGRATGDLKQERMRPEEVSQGAFCSRCGAWRGQLGLEPTPHLFVEHLVEVFREVRRVLAPHGVCWLNIGDSYIARAKGSLNGQEKSGLRTTKTQAEAAPTGVDKAAAGLKQKDLALVPQRLSIALQDDGWWVRSDVIWSKPNPMPESVQDRPSKSHEYVFMLTKSADYYFDQEAVREPPAASTVRAAGRARSYGGGIGGGDATAYGEVGRPVPTPSTGRNIRTVWEIPTQPFSASWLGLEDDDHYAVFPEDLVRPCLEATCPRQVCVRCGTPRQRLVARRSLDRNELPADHPEWRPQRYDDGKVSDGGPGLGQRFTEARTIGWTECPCQIGLPADSFAPILTPLGEGDGDDDPTLETGRRGMNRPRNDGEGVRAMTRYEQRAYAEQLRAIRDERSARSDALLVGMYEDVGREAWEHYARTDAAGARPIPPDVLEDWIERGWLERVELPEVPPGEYRTGRVLDPFSGSGTTAVVARQLNREPWGIELNPKYVRIAAERVRVYWRRPTAPKRASADQLTLTEALSEPSTAARSAGD